MCFALQVIRKGEVSCCWICTACKENEFVQDEFTCKACELGWWPNADLTGRDVPFQMHSHFTGHKEDGVRLKERWQHAETVNVHVEIPMQFRVSEKCYIFGLSSTAVTIKMAKFIPRNNIICLFLAFS